MPLTREMVLATLKTINDPVSGDIHAAGVIRALNVENGSVRFVMEINPSQAKLYEPIRQEAEDLVRTLEGCDTVSVVLTAHEDKKPPDSNPTNAPAHQSAYQALSM